MFGHGPWLAVIPGYGIEGALNKIATFAAADENGQVLQKAVVHSCGSGR